MMKPRTVSVLNTYVIQHAIIHARVQRTALLFTKNNSAPAQMKSDIDKRVTKSQRQTFLHGTTTQVRTKRKMLARQRSAREEIDGTIKQSLWRKRSSSELLKTDHDTSP